MTLRNKLAIVGASGLLFTGAAVGLTGVASAQNGDTPQETPSATTMVDDGGEDGFSLDFDLSPEDEAVFERFDQCLIDNGLDVDAIDAMLEDDTLSDDELEIQLEGLEENADQAFDACEPILEDLSDELKALEEDIDWDDEFDVDYLDGEEWIEDFDLSPEDEAVFERFDQCLEDNGIDELDEIIYADGESSDSDLSDEEIEAIEELEEQIFTTCDPILEDLSDDAGLWIEGCPDDNHDDEEDVEEDVEDGDEDGAGDDA